MEKINVTNVKIPFSDRADVKNHDLYALKTPNAAILLKLLQGNALNDFIPFQII